VASYVTEDSTAAASHQVNGAGPAGTVAAWTWSVYAKADTRTRIGLVLSNTSGYAVCDGFDLSTGTIVQAVGTSLFTSASASITDAGNGWYRCVITATPNDTSALTCVLRLHNGTSSSYNGDGVSGLYIWGAQIEAGAFPTSYIPTTTASLTRAVDAMSTTNVGWFNESHGAFLVEGSRPVFGDSYPTIVQVDDGTANNRYFVYHNDAGASNELRAANRVATVSQFDLGGGTATAITAGKTFRAALAYSANDFAFSVNGNTVLTDTSGSLPSGITTLRLFNIGPGNIPNGHIRRIRYYDHRIPNDQLQLMTTNW